ncbi:hypothetical protein [Carboxylicivirga sp. M1479]|uniref:hypothetical protein n=1 Tax=Carboxylicivirga sp. M1479 TaxID=2594476 RepID=UPI00117748AE|nr:hypothetical protein [Carboxylicivirga sp. M1479]TRX63298.1 hypothetical protein FNN09_18785 [Carboxylicivirga sp. M1479]
MKWKILIVLLPLFSACSGDLFNTDTLKDEIPINPGFTMPLMFTEVTMGELFSDETDYVSYYTDVNGFERIMLYQQADSVSVLTLDDLFDIAAGESTSPIDYSMLNGGAEFTFEAYIPITSNNGTISAMEVSYDLSISGEDMVAPLYLKIELPTVNASEGGKIIETQISNDNPFNERYEDDFFELVDQKVPAIFTVRLMDASRDYTLEIGALTFSISNLDYDYIKGTMEETTTRFESGSIEMQYEGLDEVPDGIEFAEPNINLIVTNYTPFEGIIDPYFKGEIAPLDSMELVFPDILVPPAPEDVAYVRDTLVIDNTNSNLTDFLSYLPPTIDYDAVLTLNPGFALNNEVELTDESSVIMGYLVEIPAEFRIDSYISIDTLDVDENEVLQDLQAATMVISGETSFPFDTDVFVDIYDEDEDRILDTIEAIFLEGAEINTDGIATEAKKQSQEIILTQEQINYLSIAEKLFMRMHIKSSSYDVPNQHVVITTDQSLNIAIDMKGVVDLD